MKVQQFLEHHGIGANPFADEESQTDPVFRDYCLRRTYHPTWDKIYGDPSQPATAIVFGEKGSGKTAIRLQIAAHLRQHNQGHPDQRVFVVEYDDFNPFLDRFRDRLSGRRRQPDRVLAQWKLWDHMDAILSLGVTDLADRILDEQQNGSDADAVTVSGKFRLDGNQARDLLLLAACYDQSTAGTFKGRWHRLRRKLRFRTWLTYWDTALAVIATTLIFGLIVYFQKFDWLASIWPYFAAALCWMPRMVRSLRCFRIARGIVRHVRVGIRETGSLRGVLMHFAAPEISSQPLPNKERTDDRFELLCKFQGILNSFGYSGIIVLVDRVDEPHLTGGRSEAMQAFLWPLLDNKLLKHPGVGFKLLLPIELEEFLHREERDFYQRARLDKQNLIPSLEWTGEALYDVASARIKACAVEGANPTPAVLFTESFARQRLIEAFGNLRVPRHLSKFMYRLLVAHANAHTEESPSWQITSEMFESIYATFTRDQQLVDRGLRAG